MTRKKKTIDTPSAAWKTLAVLSVLPAMIYSPVGLQAKSYTCIVVHLYVQKVK